MSDFQWLDVGQQLQQLAVVELDYDAILKAAATIYAPAGHEQAWYDAMVSGINEGSYSLTDVYRVLQNDMVNQGLGEFTHDAVGNVTGVNFYNTFQQTMYENPFQTVNSNLGGSIFRGNLRVPTNVSVNPETGSAILTKLQGGVTAGANFLFGEVAPAVAAVSAGITLGKTIDKLLYNANPDFWDAQGMASLNPDTWGIITAGDDSFLAGAFNFIFGIDPDTGNVQPYMDADALAYMAAYMNAQDFFSTAESIPDSGDFTSLSRYTFNFPLSIASGLTFSWVQSRSSGLAFTNLHTSIPTKQLLLVRTKDTATSDNLGYCVIAVSDVPFHYAFFTSGEPTVTPPSTVKWSDASEYTYNGRTVYYVGYQAATYHFYPPTSNLTLNYYGITGSADITSDTIRQLSYLMLYNAIARAIPGVGTQENATTPNLEGITGIPETLTALQNQYPDLWANSVPYTTVNPDGTTTTRTYVPVGWPDITSFTDTQPTTSNQKQSNTQVLPNAETLTKTITKTLTQPDTKTGTPTNPPTTGDGRAPLPSAPVGRASSLWAIYHPTQAQVDSFGAWLWSSDFIDQILKIFNNPMEAVIGLHKVYATPKDAGTRTIKVGYLDSGVSSAYISDQYTTVDCGNVRLGEHFGNVFDYDPYTRVMLYLPFIGIVQLNTGDVMRSTIGVKYGVDVLTGACLAMVEVSRDGGGGVMYQYAGNCAVQYPISSGSYMGIVTGIASVATGIAGAVASGGAIAPALMGGAGALMNTHTTVQHSGGFSGNAGAMGGKKPYLIIIRPQTKVAQDYPYLQGYPTNTTVKIGDCSGYVRVRSLHLDTVAATDAEKVEIETILKSGFTI